MTMQFDPTVEEEGKFHSYVTTHIPWYVRVIWLGFWILCVWYVIAFAIPMAKEFFQPRGGPPPAPLQPIR